MNTTALYYALGTVLCWGVYSVLLHLGSTEMASGAKDLLGDRMKAFLFVGIAYVLVAIVAPAIVMVTRGTSWTFPFQGWTWSLVAGIAGAVGAFFLLMGLSAGRDMVENKFVLPLVVPAIVFAGAPIVNTIVATTKAGYWKYLDWKFVAGVVIAAAGTAMVMKYKPAPPPTQSSAAPLSAPLNTGVVKTGGLPVSKPEPVAVAVREERPVAPGYADVTKRGGYFVS